MDPEPRRPDPAPSRQPWLAILALAVGSALLVGLYSGNPQLGNTPETNSSVRAAHSLIRQGDLDLAEYFRGKNHLGYAYIRRDDRVYSMEPPASSLTFAPFLHAQRQIEPEAFNPQVRILGDLSAARIAALSIFILGLWLLQLCSIPKALAATATIALATSHWTITGGGLWSHTAAIPWLTLGLLLWWQAQRRPTLYLAAGAALAFATLCRPNLVPAALIVVVDAWWQGNDRRIALSTFAIVALIGVAGLIANQEIYGSLLGGRMNIVAAVEKTHGVSSYVDFSPTSFAGLLVSPSRGLFVFSPVLLFALPGLIRTLRPGEPASLRLMSVAGLCVFGLYGFIATWWGGRTYGPRYMVDLLPFFGLWLAWTPLPRKRRALYGGLFACAFAGSVWVQQLGSSTYPCGWNTNPQHIDKAYSRVWELRDNQIRRCADVRAERRAQGVPAPGARVR
jgi:hypothetical protein